MLEADIHSRPLAGVTVLELSTIVAAPFAAQQLAEYGASVVKIESPGGDASRSMGPTTEKGMGPLFLGVNRGKKSVTLDLKTPLPERLLEAYPRLIYAGVHGFRATGPYGEHPAYDDIVQGLSGVGIAGAQTRSATALPTIGRSPTRTWRRWRCRPFSPRSTPESAPARGAYVEVPMFETMVSNVLAEHMHARHFLPPLGQAGYDRQLSAVRRPFRTLDGYVCLIRVQIFNGSGSRRTGVRT